MPVKSDNAKKFCKRFKDLEEATKTVKNCEDCGDC